MGFPEEKKGFLTVLNFTDLPEKKVNSFFYSYGFIDA